MNIFRTDINQAVTDGKLAENNFLVQKDGAIRPLGTISRKLWQSFSHIAWVRETIFGVNNKELAKLLGEAPAASSEMTDNVRYLRDNGQITTEQQDQILRRITSVSTKTGVQKG